MFLSDPFIQDLFRRNKVVGMSIDANESNNLGTVTQITLKYVLYEEIVWKGQEHTEHYDQ
jgi:hypothetical protein